MNKIPVILDTDIGSDIDDTWALAMLLRSPELELKLAVSTTFNTDYRAKLLAKMFERCGHGNIPVGIGIPSTYDQPETMVERMAPWVEDYDLKKYPGKIHADGVGAMIDTIMSSPEPVTLIAIGPMTNLAALLERAPGIEKKINLVAMIGSVTKGYEGKTEIDKEYNVYVDIPAAQKLFAAAWHSFIITPVDSCGLIRLTGAHYQQIAASTDLLMQDLIANYLLWCKCHGIEQPPKQSSILFDTVAIHLAFTTRYLTMQKFRLVVDDQGFTVPDANGREIDVATGWTDQPAYIDFLVARLLGKA